MITFEKHVASGTNWTKEMHDVLINGQRTDFCAYLQDDGTFELENSSSTIRVTEFKSLEQVAEYMSAYRTSARRRVRRA